MISCKATSSGYFHGSDDTGPYGPDINHSDAQKTHVTWDYLFEKNWFMFTLWGRLGYNPDVPENLWIKHFVKRLGPEVGEDAYEAIINSSRILPAATCFHWNYMNGDWYPEFCTGGWNTGENYREWTTPRADKFHSVIEWIFNHTIEESLLTIPQYVDNIMKGISMNGVLSPLDMANRLEEYAKQALQHLRKTSDKGGFPRTTYLLNGEIRVKKAEDEFKCMRMDVEALANLGNYYAEKIRGAVELMFFLRTWNEEHQKKSIEHLEKALEWWDRLIEVASGHYAQPRTGIWAAARRGGPEVFQWHRYRKDVLRDIEIPKQMGGMKPKTYF